MLSVTSDFMERIGNNIYYKDYIYKLKEGMTEVYYKIVGIEEAFGLFYRLKVKECTLEYIRSEIVPMSETTKAIGTRREYKLNLKPKGKLIRGDVQMDESRLFAGNLFITKKD